MPPPNPPGLKPNLGFTAAKKSHDLLGVELDEHYLKIVHVQLKGLKREVANVIVYPVRGLFDDGILHLIHQAVEKCQVVTPRTYLTVPLPLVITRNIEIPSQDPLEIKEIVNLQASRHTPYARAEIIVDTLNSGLARERYSKVLLVIVPKETVNKQIQLLDRAGLKLERVFFPPEAIAMAAVKIAGRDADGTLGILHMDHGFTTFLVVQGGKLLFVRGIHIGATQLVDEKESYLDRFQDELEKSMETYTADEVGAPPKSVMLAGVLNDVTDFDDVLNEAFKIPLKRQSYAEHFNLSEGARATLSSSKMVSFLNLIAPMTFYDKIKVDLTSEEKKLKIQLEKRAREMLKMGVLTLVLFSLVFVNVTSKISFKKAYLKQITTHYLPVRDSAKQLEQMLAKTQLVKSYLLSRGNSLQALTELYDATPLDIRLGEIKYDESSSKFSIKGTSSVMSSVFSFVSELDKSGIFKNVKTKYVTSRNENGRDVADFEINCLIDLKIPEKNEK